MSRWCKSYVISIEHPKSNSKELPIRKNTPNHRRNTPNQSFLRRQSTPNQSKEYPKSEFRRNFSSRRNNPNLERTPKSCSKEPKFSKEHPGSRKNPRINSLKEPKVLKSFERTPRILKEPPNPHL